MSRGGIVRIAGHEGLSDCPVQDEFTDERRTFEP